jgi:hypothetical protein
LQANKEFPGPHNQPEEPEKTNPQEQQGKTRQVYPDKEQAEVAMGK